jgi:hypothetical protein
LVVCAVTVEAVEMQGVHHDGAAGLAGDIRGLGDRGDGLVGDGFKGGGDPESAAVLGHPGQVVYQPHAVRICSRDSEGGCSQGLARFHHAQPCFALVAAIQQQEFDVPHGHSGVLHPEQGFVQHR